MLKQCQYLGRTESGIFCLPIITKGMEKTAAASKLHPRIQEFVGRTQITPEGIYIMVSALGAGEYWGSNVNGDLFPEKSLINSPVEWEGLSVDQMQAVGKVWPYGYPTFMNAYPYKHHANKDPSRAFGRVELAVWNPQMHRVELVVYLDRNLCMQFDGYDIIQRIERGEYPDVSMGCLPRGSKVLTQSGQYVGIETIKKGDIVISHKGRSRRVISTMVRPHKGTIFNIKAYGHRDPIVLTGEHPLWLVRQEQTECRPSSYKINKGRKQHVCIPGSAELKQGCHGCKTVPEYKFDWIRTDEASVGDYLALPLPTFEVTRKFSIVEARLLGYYLAEGLVLRTKAGNPMAVQFCTGLHEVDTHEELHALGESLGVNVTEYDAEDRNGKYINFWDRSFAELCAEHCGEKAKTKLLSASLMGANTDTLNIFLGAYANGDGGAYKGSLYFSTSSIELSEQLRIILARCGMIASVNEIVHKPSKNSVVSIETIEYQVWVGTDTSSRLITSRLELSRSIKLNSKRFFYQYQDVTYLMTPIESIEEVSYDDLVYNFGVADDESYIVEGLAVHNCRVPFDVCTICGHQSKTREDYCEHAGSMMNRILPDGRKVAVRNDTPRFFDISFVFIGADKTAKVMAKLAQQGNQVCMGDFCTIPRLSIDVGAVFSKEAVDVDKLWRGLEKRKPGSWAKRFPGRPFLDKQANDPIKKSIRIAGMDIGIEWLRGETRKYKSGFSQEMKADYGYIKNTKDADDEELDVYVGPKRNSEKVYIVKQLKDDGSFDEHKVMLGYDSYEDAKSSYLDHMPPKKFKSMEGMGVKEFKKTNLKEAKELAKEAGSCGCHGLGDDCGGSVEKLGHLLFPEVSLKTASHTKFSEIIKSVPAGPFTKETLPRIEQAERDIPPETLDLMAGQGLGPAVSTPGMMGMVLKPREFQRIVLTRMGEQGLANDLDAKNMTFQPTQEIDESIPVDESLSDPRIKELLQLQGLFRDRTIASPALQRRSREAQRPAGMPAGTTGADPVLNKIAAAYNGYRRSLIKKASQIERTLELDPQLRADLYGRSMVEAFAGGTEKTGSVSVLGPDSLAYLVGAFSAHVGEFPEVSV